MYNLINIHIQSILGTIPLYHVQEYDWLIQYLNQCATPLYQRRYKRYWKLNSARLSANYCNVYFNSLQEAQVNIPAIENLLLQLYNTPVHRNDQQSLQLSFTSKLIHMVNPNAPIYDSNVADFYFFYTPNFRRPVQIRINTFNEFYTFLVQEYARILNGNLLAPSIQAFRQRFNPIYFTDEKIIDSLIWAYVDMLKNGALVGGTVLYV